MAKDKKKDEDFDLDDDFFAEFDEEDEKPAKKDKEKKSKDKKNKDKKNKKSGGKSSGKSSGWGDDDDDDSKFDDEKEGEPRDPKIVIRSTVPIGYTKELQKKHPDWEFYFMPEFLREGKGLYDEKNPARIVVGITKPENEKFAHQLANEYIRSANPKTRPQVFVVDSDEAEAIKLFSNEYLAQRIAFFNELDTFALESGLSSKEIIDAVSADPRIGNEYNNPSFAYGGYCLPKDTKQLKASFKKIPQELVSATIESNKHRKYTIARDIIAKVTEIQEKNPIVGFYHLAMKSGSDNFRESPNLEIIKLLSSQNIDIIIYEPSITEPKFEGHKVINNLKEFANKVDLIAANRVDNELRPYIRKVYTRDLYGNN